MKEDMMEIQTAISPNSSEYVSIRIGPQLFGLPIIRVHDVFMPEAVTVVPLAPPEIAGVLNLRGRIVTAINIRSMLGLQPPEKKSSNIMAVGIEFRGESYGLLIDAVGEVLRLTADDIDQNPINLDSRWVSVSDGVYRLEGELMVILNVDRLLASQMPTTKAA